MSQQEYTAFEGSRRIATGPVDAVLPLVKKRFDRDAAAGPSGNGERVLIFEEGTARQIDFDLRGTLDEVLARAVRPPAGTPRPGPGRPKLGVVSREVSLLPRHWDWLEIQPNGLSAALRRLVDEARKRAPDADRERLAIEATGRFMTAMAGDMPNFEEATRALYAKDHARLAALVRKWPKDIRAHLARLASFEKAAKATPDEPTP